jgi:hypothetical protein
LRTVSKMSMAQPDKAQPHNLHWTSLLESPALCLQGWCHSCPSAHWSLLSTYFSTLLPLEASLWQVGGTSDWLSLVTFAPGWVWWLSKSPTVTGGFIR